MDILTPPVRDTIFWGFFALMGLFLILQLPFIEVFLGIIIIILGITKLGKDLENRHETERDTTLTNTLDEIRQWLEREHRQLKRVETKYENRFFQSNRKQIEAIRTMNTKYRDLDKRLERQGRELVRKLLKIDNKLADVSRAFLTSRPRSGRGK